MDDIDRRIVALLRENARRSFKDIGGHVHLTAPAVKRPRQAASALVASNTRNGPKPTVIV